jgi:glycosyltransferase involved in cell wall biosynthesis
MSRNHKPHVSILTPVFNGGRYLQQCIESVVAQSYPHWDYLIVNNGSTDNTLDIANEYARRDQRIRVITNSQFVGVVENHNIAFRLISNDSEYCKVISADDYLFTNCVEKLVDLGEQYPKAGILGSYAVNDGGVHWARLPLGREIFCGAEICRMYLLGQIDPVGAPSSLLYRSAVVKSQNPFYPGTQPNADWSAFLRTLQAWEFGFVSQILSYERVHSSAISTNIQQLNGFLIDRLQFLHEYGRAYLSQEEIKRRTDELLKAIYAALAIAVVNGRGKKVWEYQHQRLEAIGFSIRPLKLAEAISAKITDLIFNPKQSAEKTIRRLKAAR